MPAFRCSETPVDTSVDTPVKLLALDTATDLCSAALWLDGSLHWREALRPRGQGQLILPMIDELLAQAGMGLRQLDAIAFGRGPGAFTGVRMALSVAQGLAFSADLPLLAVSDLRAVAAQALSGVAAAADRVVICQDARMNEVYWGCFQRSARIVDLIGTESVGAPGSVILPQDWAGAAVCGAGSGFGAYRPALSAIADRLAGIDDTLAPRAREIAQLAAADGLSQAVAAEQAQPVYLRDEVAKVSIAPSSSRN
jgi:tRNA threonylcarbamoyladenosine biosynthesis protein TsaB